MIAVFIPPTALFFVRQFCNPLIGFPEIFDENIGDLGFAPQSYASEVKIFNAIRMVRNVPACGGICQNVHAAYATATKTITKLYFEIKHHYSRSDLIFHISHDLS